MDYKNTLNLPSTKFAMKANLPNQEPLQLKEWDENQIYKKQREYSKGKTPFILHDGPPYANGHLHIGHAINKILKDIIVKSKQMVGYDSIYVPGWDCHGLPIEHNVDKKLGSKKANMTDAQVRKECRTYASKYIDIQKKEFKRFGVIGDWNKPYLTMDYAYESIIARECGKFALKGDMFLGKKPVYWCCNCKTALAEAEIEYKDHTSPSIFIKFPLQDDMSDILPNIDSKDIFIVIWTTTPWTIPANLGICLHPDFVYSAVKTLDQGVLIVAKDLVDNSMKAFGINDYTVIKDITAASLEKKRCKHPFYDQDSLIMLARHVTLDSGTGCVHTAPGHGADDHIIGKKYGLDSYSPVDDNGVFTNDVKYFNGQFIFKANQSIVDKLNDCDCLLSKKSLSHSYPHCWRCKSPVIFRATPQWFISMDKLGLRKKSLDEINNVDWIPAWGRERIYSMIENRPDWCLSRQRSWGVPIPVFHCKDCLSVYVTKESIDKIENLFSKYSSDIWFKKDAKFLMPQNVKCEECGSDNFIKDNNILDVWFDSGVSYAAVLEERKELEKPADMYLEGSDQHRGWFHSALLTSVGLSGEAPYKSVLTHGFVVDEKGRKMSKSEGNVVAPETIINKYGADILRLWVASADYRTDISISDNIIKQLSDAYRRIRNTCRFMLGNLSDFDLNKDFRLRKEMSELDRLILHRLYQFIKKSLKAYEKYEFHTIYHDLHNFCANDLSAFYLDIIKDRLYILPSNDLRRKDAQTAMFIVLDSIVRIIAPVLSFTAEEIYKHIPKRKEQSQSILLELMPKLDEKFYDKKLSDKWKKIIVLRKEVTKSLEEARINKIIGHPLDAELEIKILDSKFQEQLNDLDEKLNDIFIVSKITFVQNLDEKSFKSQEIQGLEIKVNKSLSQKCERCWRFDTSVNKNKEHPNICSRCHNVLEKIL